jgi:group II intron reverse transcriptase/maturase
MATRLPEAEGSASGKGQNSREGDTNVSLRSARHQKSMQMELVLNEGDEVPGSQCSGEAPTAANGDGSSGNDCLMEKVVERSNVEKALKRVKKNKGSPGIDGMTVDELPAFLNANWKAIRASLLDGTYRPQAVREQEIPKSGGGVRKLGIPTVLDRLIQQAILQVLQPKVDPTFSQHSHGFRPGRSAHGAVCEAQQHIQAGLKVVVDVDLEKFFDRVNHDVLMGRLAKRFGDKRLLRLIRRYLVAGIMVNGVVMEREEGTPQGGPLSPLLANVLLDEVDKELEKRELAFVRYADDCNVYVRSERAGTRVMEALKGLYARLKLRINESKSAVAKVRTRKFLGYSFWFAKGGLVKARIANESLVRMKERVRNITRRHGGRSIKAVIADLVSYLPGWKQYFHLAPGTRVLQRLDEWIRHRLRVLQLVQWKRNKTTYRALRRLGAADDIARQVAANTRRWWKTAAGLLQTVLTASYYDRHGVPRLAG